MADALKTDLALERRGTGVRTSDRDGVELAERRGDLAVATGRENLAQALLNRLHTRRGALAALGHPGYGSRLHTLAMHVVILPADGGEPLGLTVGTV